MLTHPTPHKLRGSTVFTQFNRIGVYALHFEYYLCISLLCQSFIFSLFWLFCGFQFSPSCIFTRLSYFLGIWASAAAAACRRKRSTAFHKVSRVRFSSSPQLLFPLSLFPIVFLALLLGKRDCLALKWLETKSAPNLPYRQRDPEELTYFLPLLLCQSFLLCFACYFFCLKRMVCVHKRKMQV